MAELDISSLVGRETLGQYAAQLEERHRKRGRRAREEKRREKKIHLEERRLMGRYPRYQTLHRNHCTDKAELIKNIPQPDGED